MSDVGRRRVRLKKPESHRNHVYVVQAETDFTAIISPEHADEPRFMFAISDLESVDEEPA